MKKLMVLVLTILSLSANAAAIKNDCPVHQANFHKCFQNDVMKRCTAHGGPRWICSHMHFIHFYMMLRYKSVWKACADNTPTMAQTVYCINDWSCYLHGHYYGSNVRCGGKSHA